jgi:hypothetical protein
VGHARASDQAQRRHDPEQLIAGLSEIAMTYRSLLVLLDADPLCAARTQLAIRLARENDCHLVGVAPTGLLDLPVSIKATSSLTEYAALARDTLRQQGELAAERFRVQCRAAGLRSFEGVVDEADKAQSLVRHAHCSDLTLLSQANPSAFGHHGVKDMVEQVLLQIARPTLILP